MPAGRAKRVFRFGLLGGLCLAIAWVSAAATREESPSPGEIPADGPLGWRTHTGGLVRTLITNFGQIGSNPGFGLPWGELPSAQWPGESRIEYLWAGGWWLGALVDGTPRVTTAVFQLEFRPDESGPAGVYPSAEGAIGGHRFPSATADDDGDGRVDEDWPNGRDDDGDGRLDEDFAAISEQMLASSFADTSSIIQQIFPNHEPLGIDAQQAALGWSRPELDDFVGIDLLLVNVLEQNLEQVYVGFFADCDIGSLSNEGRSADDRAGFWEGNLLVPFEGSSRNVDLSVGYAYDGDGDGGSTPGYIGFVFLGAEKELAGNPRFLMRNFRMFSGAQSYPLGGDPTNDTERYSCLDGSAPRSLVIPAATPREAVTATFDSDWRLVVSMGPFERLAPQDSLRIAMAMVLGNGFDDMLMNAARAKLLYQGVAVDCDGNENTPELCAVRWTTPRTVSIGLQDFTVQATPEATRLTWRLNADTRQRLLGLGVQRSSSPAGPFVSRTLQLLPPSTTAFTDVLWDDETPPATGFSLWYRLALHALDGTLAFSEAVAAERTAATTALAAPRQTDAEGVQIDFTLSAPSEARLVVLDVSGRVVRTLHQGFMQAGVHHRRWDGRNASGRRVARGIYLVRLEAGPTASTRKLVLLAP